jgi:excisionase family DNA binding protein
MTDLLTVPEAAKILEVKPVTVYQAIREGRLRSITMLGKKVLHRADVEEYKQRTGSVGPQGGRPRKTDTEEGKA